MNVAAPAEPRTWSRNRWLLIFTLIFAAHVGFIFAFGARKPVIPRAATNVPQLQLVSDGELIALNDPTLFALPNPKDFASSQWLKMPDVKQLSFRWTEAPLVLQQPDPKNLGATFSQFMQTNYFAGYEFQAKPPPQLSAPVLPITPALAQTSTLQIIGDLAQRRLLNEINPPSLPYNDVIAPNQVQVLVDSAGNVISAVLLPTENSLEIASHYDGADQRALELARAARFAPAPRLTFGQLIFKWHTVPMVATNAPATAP